MILMEIILVVLQPKQNIGNHDYRSKLYNVLLLDHKPTTGDKSKPTKYLPTFPLTNTGEEPRDEVLGNLYRLTGGEHSGIKGERAILIPWNSRDHRVSLSKFYLYCVPVNSRDKLNKVFVEKSPNSPGFFSLDTMVETLNNGMTNYPPPTQTFISQLESWLKEKHSRPGSLDILFQNRADYRIKFSINNPAFLPSRHEVSPESNGIIVDDTPDDIRLTANEALAKELAIEKCDIVVINPIFGSQMPYKTNVNNFVRNIYWPSTPPDYDSRRSSDTSSIEGTGIGTLVSSMDDQFQLHKYAAEGNCEVIMELISRGFRVNDTDIKHFNPLHYASANGHQEAVQLLLRVGANPNARTDSKATALHLAAMYGHVHVAETLLQHPHINTDLQDRRGKTALNLCEETQYWAQKHIGKLIRAASKSNTQEIEICLTDKAKKKLKLVNGLNTTVQQLNLQLFREYNMSDEVFCEIFTIWICSKSLELQLRPDHCPMNELQLWNRNVKMLTDANPDNDVPEFRWRRNAKIGLKEEKGVNHPQAVHILFHEAYNNYIQALYPCKDQDVLTFASILIYKEQRGEFDSASAKSHVNNNKSLQKLVPGPMLKAKSSNWASRILHHYKEFCPRLADTMEGRHSTQEQRDQALKRQFLDYCRHLTVYGSAFFRGMLLTSQGKGGQTACHIGVNDVGIHIINSQTGVMLHSFKYSEIKWKHEDGNSLEIIVRLESNIEKNVSREVKLRTKQAGLIHNLMEKLKQMHASKDRSVNIVYS
ncbi:krev interaction trapped protein 1-like [Argopecten irradians]|uniref:krev interaction trapped protein 1-like n=1 Tax=Argopecten irradians TaxID=31199 RepID=UPI0037187086